jgi:hypothetical protein
MEHAHADAGDARIESDGGQRAAEFKRLFANRSNAAGDVFFC